MRPYHLEKYELLGTLKTLLDYITYFVIPICNIWVKYSPFFLFKANTYSFYLQESQFVGT